MPALVVANAALVTLRWTNNGVAYVNVLGASVLPTTTISQSLANTLDTSIKAAFTTELKPHFNAATALVSVGIRDIRTANLAEFIGTGAVNGGTSVGEALPKQTALVVTLRTARAGQSFRGRVYISGWTETDNDTNGNCAPAAQQDAVDFVTAIGNSLTSNGLTLAVVSRPSERRTVVTTTFHADGTSDVDTDVSEARGGQVTNVTSITARNNVWDTQRRRAAAGSVSTFLTEAVTSVLSGPDDSAQVLQDPSRSRK